MQKKSKHPFLWGRNGATDEEKDFTDKFTSMVDHIKKYILDHRDEIEKYDLEASDLKKFNPLFWKMEKGKVVEGRGPMLYAKALYNKKKEKIETIFVNEETNEEVDPFELLNKICSATAALKIESIFIGNKISLQVKLFEVVYKVKDSSVRGLLRPNALKRVEGHPSEKGSIHPANTPSGEDDEEDDDDGSILLEGENDHSAVTTTLPVQHVPVVSRSTLAVAPPVSLDLSDDEDDEDDEEEASPTPPPARPLQLQRPRNAGVVVRPRRRSEAFF